MDIRHAEHHIYRLEYHLVWTPKYRHPVFQEPQRTVLKEILVKTAYDYDMEILEIEIPPDHIHEDAIRKYIQQQLEEERRHIDQMTQLTLFE